MKLSLALVLAFVLAAVIGAAPLPLPPAMGAEASLTDSIRSFESAVSQLDDRIHVAAQKKAAYTVRERWAGGVAAGMTTLGTAGYIASSAIPMATNRREAKRVDELKSAVARAKGSAQTRPGMRKRSGLEEVAEKALAAGLDHHPAEEGNESFVTAWSRTSSQRLSDFTDHDKTQYAKLLKSYSVPLYISRSPPAYAELRHSASTTEAIATHERLSAIESALLDVKQHHHDAQQLSPFSKAMIGVSAGNAIAGVASAELSAQNAIEAARKKKDDDLPDVSGLDYATCLEYAKDIDNLDCKAAHGGASKH